MTAIHNRTNGKQIGTIDRFCLVRLLATLLVSSLALQTGARAQDCNSNGIPDACDISCGTPGGACDVAGCGGSIDVNFDGIPDDCVYPLVFERVMNCGKIYIVPGNAINALHTYRRNGNTIAIYQQGQIDSLGAPQSFDADGNLMIPEWNPDRVSVVSRNGTLVRTITGGGLDGPTCAVLTPDKKIAVCSYLSDSVKFYTHGGTYLSAIGGTQDPLCMAYDRDKNLYVGCRNNGNGHIAVFNPQLQPIGVIAQGQFAPHPLDIAFDSAQNLYVTTPGSIKKFNRTGTLLGTLAQPGLDPTGIAIDETGVLWVTNKTTRNIYRFSSTGEFISTIPVDLGPGAPSSLALYGIAIDVKPDTDCNNNGTGDACDIEGGAADCNHNSLPDSCEISGNDCDGNNVLDICDPDCDGDHIPDACEIAGGAVDCNNNDIPDSCELTSTIIADSAGEFSSTQGQSGWWYGYLSSPFATSTFQLLDQYGLDNDFSPPILMWHRQLGFGGYYTAIGSEVMHPNGPTTCCGRQNVANWVDRRWISDRSGAIHITGHVAKADALACGGCDGVTARIFVGGTQVWSQSIAQTDSVGVNFDLAATVSLGTKIDFVVDGNGYDGRDLTQFTAVIRGGDCNNNGILDECDISGGASVDCNSNLIPDECESTNDCNQNGTPDLCEQGGLDDCDRDGITDLCEFASGATDCNSNGTPDSCDMAQLNKGLQFDGVDDYLNAGGAAVLNLTNGITIEAWVRPDNTSGFHVIVSKGQGGQPGYGFITQNGKLDFVAYGIQDYFSTGTYLATGVWKHVAVVFDSSSDAHYYVNGQFVETVAGNTAPNQSSNPLLLGRTSLSGAEWWAGGMDEVRIWSVARTSNQISSQYATRLTGNESGLVAYWRFDEGSGQFAVDSSTNSNDATLGSTLQTDNNDPTWIVSGSPIPAGDCNNNGVIDECDISSGSSQDCNNNDIPDECESQADCNNNSILDICEPNGSNDCDGDGQTDFCEFSSGMPDCNSNQVPDNCDANAGNSVLEFDTSNQRVVVPSSPTLEPAKNLTVECWIRPDSVGFGNNSRIVRKAASAGYILSWRQAGTNRLQLRIDKGTGNVVVQDTVNTATYLGTWIHVAGVYSAPGNFARLYVNGVLKAETTASGPLLYTSSNLGIGNDPAGTEGFDGRMDEVRIWNVARTGAQIAADMHKSFATSRPGLVGYWKLNAGSGQTAIDSSGLGNSGTLGTTASTDASDPTWMPAGSSTASDADCNGNGIPDACDLSAGTVQDCNSNNIPDTCESDCNNNGIADSCDISSGAAQDCNGNGVPDSCDIAFGTSTDINSDGVPDSCQPDVRVVPVVTLINPAQTSEVRTSLPTSLSAVTRGGSYYVEIWASDVGTTNTGLTGVYVNMTFCPQTAASALDHGSIFNVFPSGTIQSGKVDEFGGSALPSGGGIQPQWVRVGWITMQASTESPSCSLALQSSAGGVGAFNRGLINWAFVGLDSVQLQITPPAKTYDLDNSGVINVGDLSLFAGSWLQTVPPGNTAHDFDCDDTVGVGDLSWFATGWLKNVNDPSILYPPCPSGLFWPPSGDGGDPRDGQPDIQYRLIAKNSPSGSDATTTLPGSITSISAGQQYYLEVWVSDVGDINTGVTSAYVDLNFPTAAGVLNINHNGVFTLFPSGSVITSRVDELGGSSVNSGNGNEPIWARVATVRMFANSAPPLVIFSLTSSNTGTAAYGRGTIPWSSIALDTLSIGTPGPGDVNADGYLDNIDVGIFVNVLLGLDTDPQHVARSNLNQDGAANGLDIQLFTNAFMTQ